MEIEKLERRHVISISLQSDTIDDAISSLRNIATHFRMYGVSDSVSGGYGSGYTITYKENPDMTHDKYFEMLDDYINRHD